MMKYRPILFSGEMVRAILDGSKTQTRRVMKPQVEDKYWDKKMNNASIWNPRRELLRFCPYGKPGDRLWVRETYVNQRGKDYYRADGELAFMDHKWTPSIFMPRRVSRITLEVVRVRVERVQEITPADAKAEGVSHIWEMPPKDEKHFRRVLLNPYVANYSVLWDEINAKRGFGWDVNPWVWVLEYKPLIVKEIKPPLSDDVNGRSANYVIIDDPFKAV